jgi:hypothetical protein
LAVIGGLLESLRFEERVDQIEEQEKRRDSGQQVVHNYNNSHALVRYQHTAKKANPTAM